MMTGQSVVIPFMHKQNALDFVMIFFLSFFHFSFFEASRDYLYKIIWSLSDFQQYFGMLVFVGSNIKYLFGIAMFMLCLWILHVWA